MHHPRPNVLPLRDVPRQKSALCAISKIVRDLKAEHGLTNVELAEEIGVSAETISNAENENNLLNLVTFLRIWYEFGEDAVRPILNLAERQYAFEPETADDHIAAIRKHLDALERA